MTSYSFGQIAQLVKAFSEADVTPEALSRLGQAGKKRLDYIDAYLREEAKFVRVKFLTSAGSIRLPALERPLPFREKNDAPDYKIWFRSHTEVFFQHIKSRAIQEMELAYSDLVEPCNDFQILGEIDAESVLEIDELSFQLGRLIKKQGDGKQGALLSDGKATLFYFRNSKDKQLLCMAVCWQWYWRAHSWGWCVDVRTMDAHVWPAGTRVFYKCASSDS